MSELALDSAHKRYLLVDLAIGATIVNFLLNLGLGWLFLRGDSGIAMTADVGEPSISGEIFGTTLLLPFFTGIIVTPLAKRMIGQGKLPVLGWRRNEQRWLARLPRSSFLRALLVGIVCVTLIGVPTIIILSGAGVEWIEAGDYIFIKGIFSGLLAAPVTPLFGIAALADFEAK